MSANKGNQCVRSQGKYDLLSNNGSKGNKLQKTILYRTRILTNTFSNIVNSFAFVYKLYYLIEYHLERWSMKIIYYHNPLGLWGY